jgi:hypothetical protein
MKYINSKQKSSLKIGVSYLLIVAICGVCSMLFIDVLFGGFLIIVCCLMAFGLLYQRTLVSDNNFIEIDNETLSFSIGGKTKSVTIGEIESVKYDEEQFWMNIVFVDKSKISFLKYLVFENENDAKKFADDLQGRIRR